MTPPVWPFSGTRRWVYPQRVTGRFQRWHRWTGRVLLGFLVVVPWIPVGGHPAVRFDLPARRLAVLGNTFTATDGFLFVLMGLFAAFSLFFFTSLFGRLWCGYACPQTVFLEELVRPIEHAIEGDRNRRMRRDQGPLSFDRIWRKVAKWSAFATVAFAIAMSFQAWFAGAPALWTGRAGAVDYALVGIFTTAWFVDFAWFREQLCNYVCPYARFQGALTDEESQVVEYDALRGEPRGGTAKARGGCVDCDRCVAVCPQGIDIRDGFQLECINCARCVDACTDVMGTIGYPSLVSYTNQVHRPARWIRPRTVAYSALLSAVGAVGVFLVATHAPVEVTLQRAPGTLYSVDPDGAVRNTFLVRVASRTDTPSSVEVRVDGLPGAEVLLPETVVPAGGSAVMPLVIRVPPGTDLPRTVELDVHVIAADADVIRHATFKTPGGE